MITYEIHSRKAAGDRLTALALKSFDQAAGKGLDSADCTELLVWWLGEGGKA